jgi:hypothetical protein
MPNLKVRYTCQLGNLIKKIQHAIQVALVYNYNVIIPYHKYFNTTYIVINPDVTTSHPCILDKHDFFIACLIKNIDSNLFFKNKNKEDAINILKKIFKIRNSTRLESTDLLIHIRSGDIFVNPHPGYIMPPLSYFTEIINKNSFTDIYLVAEDTRNPCILKLLELYPKIKFTIQSLEQDIDLILGASNVISTYGSFIPSLLTISEHIKNIYIPSYAMFDFYIFFEHPTIHIHSTELTAYRDQQTPFQNTTEQSERMLTYALP